MTTPFTPPDQTDLLETLQQDANAWVNRLSSGTMTRWEAEALRRWRALSARHEAAFMEAREQWRLLKPALANLVNSNQEVANYHRHTLREPKISRRAWLGAAVGAAGLAGVAVVYPPLGLWPAVNEWNANYRTAAGEQRAITLAAQVSVTMNTRTSIGRIVPNGEAMSMDLLGGEAAIDLAAAKRSFSVLAGAGRSVAESGRFEVRYLDGKACVTCIEGSVKVLHPAGARLLQARQQASYDLASISGVADIDPADVSAWRSGELVFRQTPLVKVLDEINRYRSGRVVFMGDASLRNDTLSARFQLARLDTALLQIQRSFGLNASTLPGGLLILS